MVAYFLSRWTRDLFTEEEEEERMGGKRKEKWEEKEGEKAKDNQS